MTRYREYLSVLLAGALVATTATTALPRGLDQDDDHGPIKHVLLISIDGMHAVDFLNCTTGALNGGTPYCPTLLQLAETGINYRNASTSKPSDSFPGLTSIVSGGSPRSFGVYYDVAYDRVLAPPTITTGNGVAGGTCTANKPNGTRTEYEEGIDLNQNLLNGGAPGAAPTDGGFASIDPNKLIRDPYNNCAPVYPWNFPRTNTIFGVIHQHGGYTAWSDKHPAYSSVSGPGNGNNLDDFYAPEINSDATLPANIAAVAGVTTSLGESCANLDESSAVSQSVDSFFDIRCYDQLKVNAILNEIAGKNHPGTAKTKVPGIFGMNFQAVSVGQKLIENGVYGGYTDAQGTPTPSMLKEIEFTDAALGQMVSALKAHGLFESTMIVITAKHGQSPIDPKRFLGIPGHNATNGVSPVTLLDNADMGFIPYSESPNNPTGIGATEDDVSLIWLTSPNQTGAAVTLLEDTSNTPGNSTYVGLGQIYFGQSIRSMIDTPGYPAFTGQTPVGDPRTPDIIVTPNVGIIYTGSGKKQAEHGGFAHDDTNVMLLLSNPSFTAKTVASEVQTAQVAPTILSALGFDPSELDTVKLEGTPVLPAVQLGTPIH
ncbi:MAG TPA: alkaline phosphatase family protein [Bryobacteraceae bacterium]|nr:alkaline phosphatase family protein [Bryobacteraceae bacterium]